jgi:hypothetical protein
MFRFLRHACHAANLARARNEPLKPAFLNRLSVRYDRIVAQGLTFREAQVPLDAAGFKKRGRAPPRRASPAAAPARP